MRENDAPYLPEFCRKPKLILGCGNRLLGDDGFGPAVVDTLVTKYDIPNDVYVMDVGTGIRRILVTLCLGSTLPDEIIIVDSVDMGRVPGDIFTIPIDEIPKPMADDFSLHTAPGSDLARVLRSGGVKITILACQIERVPSMVMPGLSRSLTKAVNIVTESVAKQFGIPKRYKAVAITA